MVTLINVQAHRLRNCKFILMPKILSVVILILYKVLKWSMNVLLFMTIYFPAIIHHFLCHSI